MTIEARASSCRSAIAAGFEFVLSPEVGIVSVSACRDSMPQERALEACVAELLPQLRKWQVRLPRHALYAFVATPYWAHMNAVLRRRGLWKRAELGWAARSAVRSPDIEFVDAQGSRFAGIALVSEEELFQAANYLRFHLAGFLILARDVRLEESSVQAMFARAFPHGESRVDWSSLTSGCASSDDVVLKISGAFDDPEVAIDAFMSNNVWSLLAGRDQAAGP